MSMLRACALLCLVVLSVGAGEMGTERDDCYLKNIRITGGKVMYTGTGFQWTACKERCRTTEGCIAVTYIPVKSYWKYRCSLFQEGTDLKMASSNNWISAKIGCIKTEVCTAETWNRDLNIEHSIVPDVLPVRFGKKMTLPCAANYTSYGSEVTCKQDHMFTVTKGRPLCRHKDCYLKNLRITGGKMMYIGKWFTFEQCKERCANTEGCIAITSTQIVNFYQQRCVLFQEGTAYKQERSEHFRSAKIGCIKTEVCTAESWNKLNIEHSIVPDVLPVRFGKKVTVSCAANYTSPTKTMTCGTDNKFSGEPPVCHHQDCYLDNVKFTGGEPTLMKRKTTFAECKALCAETKGCLAVTWWQNANRDCYSYRNSNYEAATHSAAISAKISCIKKEERCFWSLLPSARMNGKGVEGCSPGGVGLREEDAKAKCRGEKTCKGVVCSETTKSNCWCATWQKVTHSREHYSWMLTCA